MNGPSGRTLDNFYLTPLGVTRHDSWLCDLLPESRINPSQQEAINRLGLHTTVPNFNKKELASEIRGKEILSELFESKAETLILLGDLPIQNFLKKFSDSRHRNLSDFGETPGSYGKAVETKIGGQFYNVISLCHPRQAGQLGASNLKWAKLHSNWITQKSTS